MSFIKRWELGTIQDQIGACAAQMNSNYNDGFVQWHCKQDLLIVKYQLDEILRTASKFADEAAFVEQLDKQLVWKRLNEKTNQ